MRIIFAGGGTAGHINPALAVAGYIREKNKDAEILFIGNEDSMEQRLVPKAGFAFETIKISGFKRSFSPKAIKHNVLTVKRTFSSKRHSKEIIKKFKPDICMGTGGYVSGPVISAAQSMGIPTVIHEQNAFPGVTTKMLSEKARKVMLASDAAKKHLKPNVQTVLTGNPVRGEILRSDKTLAKKELGLDNRSVILSFGGSLGARKINEAMVDLVVSAGQKKDYQIIHAYGQYGTWFPDMIKEKGCDIKACDNLDIREYIHNMAQVMAAADLVICRAGAITLSELQVQGKASILIPSPNVAENHQYHNAMALVNENAAALITEDKLTAAGLKKKADDILSNRERLMEYEKNAKRLAILDSNERIYSIIMKVISGR